MSFVGKQVSWGGGDADSKGIPSLWRHSKPLRGKRWAKPGQTSKYVPHGTQRLCVLVTTGISWISLLIPQNVRNQETPSIVCPSTHQLLLPIISHFAAHNVYDKILFDKRYFTSFFFLNTWPQSVSSSCCFLNFFAWWFYRPETNP